MEQLRGIEQIDGMPGRVKVRCCAEGGVVAGTDAGEIDMTRALHGSSGRR